MSQSNLGAKIFLGFIIFMCLEIFALSTGSFPMAGMVLIAGSVLLIMAFASVGREMMNGSGGNAAQEIAQLHQEMSSLQQRLQQLERGSDAVNSPLAPAPARVEEPVVSHTTVSVTEPEDQGHDSDRRDPDDISTQGEPEVPRNSETDFVRTWVTRVGIAILVLGVSFLVGYTFKYLGPLARILTGYAFSTVLFGLGMYWESRPRYQNFGRALLAGGWALIYFTTYAMYYFPVSRVIQGQVLAGILLFLVSLGMIAHALKYKSEGVFAAALFMAYVTVVIGSITWFSYTAILFLGIALAALSSYFGWMRSLILGTFLTYFIHITRIGPAIPLYMNLVFVTSYWLIFIAGFHFLPRLAKPSYDLRVGGANFGNLFLWSVLGFPLIKELYFDQRLWIVLAAGLCYGGWALFAHHHGKEGLRRSDIFGAIFLITASFPLRFSNDTTLLLWTIEIPFLLYAWIAFREQIFRYAGYVLFFVVSAWMCDMVGSFGSHWSRHEGVLLLYALCTAVCAVLLNWSKTANDPLGDGEVAMDHVFSFASFLAALRLLDLQFSDLKLVSALILVCGFLFVLFAVFRMKRFLWYAYILLFILVCRYIEVDLFQYRLKTIWNHVVGIGLAMAFGLGYGIRRKTLVGGEPVERISSELWYCLLAGGFVLLLYCNTYAPDNWVSFLWGLAGTVLIALGILIQDARLRYGGFIAFGLVVLRIFFVDMASLGILAKTISMILVGILFLGVSFIYSRLNIGVDQGKSA